MDGNENSRNKEELCHVLDNTVSTDIDDMSSSDRGMTRKRCLEKDKDDYVAKIHSDLNKLHELKFKHSKKEIEVKNITSKISQDTPNFFKEDNKGPYGVWLEKIKPVNEELSPFAIGNIVYPRFPSINDIKRKTRFRVEVLFRDRKEANDLIACQSITQFNLKTFIPGYRRIRKAILRNMPTHISPESIMNCYETNPTNIKICDIKRLKMRNRAISEENPDKWIDSRSIVITFEGQELPAEISIFKVRSKVEPFVQRPLQCFSCFKFGHTGKNCRGKQLCIMCGELKHEGKCVIETPTCVNCKQNHKSIDFNCPVFIQYKKIYTIMPYQNIPFNDARKQVFPEVEQTNILTKENYPALQDKSFASITKNGHKNGNKNVDKNYIANSKNTKDFKLIEEGDRYTLVEKRTNRKKDQKLTQDQGTVSFADNENLDLHHHEDKESQGWSLGSTVDRLQKRSQEEQRQDRSSLKKGVNK